MREYTDFIDKWGPALIQSLLEFLITHGHGDKLASAYEEFLKIKPEEETHA
jgi:hypothetical protein